MALSYTSSADIDSNDPSFILAMTILNFLEVLGIKSAKWEVVAASMDDNGCVGKYARRHVR